MSKENYIATACSVNRFLLNTSVFHELLPYIIRRRSCKPGERDLFPFTIAAEFTLQALGPHWPSRHCMILIPLLDQLGQPK
jgi:hypothetical protein